MTGVGEGEGYGKQKLRSRLDLRHVNGLILTTDVSCDFDFLSCELLRLRLSLFIQQIDDLLVAVGKYEMAAHLDALERTLPWRRPYSSERQR